MFELSFDEKDKESSFLLCKTTWLMSLDNRVEEVRDQNLRTKEIELFFSSFDCYGMVDNFVDDN